MGKEIVVREQKFYNEFKNGKLFTDNLTDFTNNLTGYVMEKQKAVFVVDVTWDFKASASNTVSSSASTGKITKSSGSFIDDGFSVGGLFDMFWTDNTGNKSLFNITIDSISGSSMFCTPQSGTMPDSSANGFVNSSVYLVGKTELTSVVWKFGLVENSDTFNAQNLITNSEQAYYGGSLNFATWTDLQSLGTNKDWVTGNIRVRKIATGIYGIQRFEVEHEFIIPFYKEGDDFIQLPSYLDGLNSIKYTFNAEFRTVISNPNSGKSFIYESQTGSVGYYNEVFNGFQTGFFVDDVAYLDFINSSSADGIIPSSRTTVSIKVGRTSGSFISGQRFGVYLGYQAKAVDYTNTTTTFVDNFIYDKCLSTQGAPAVDGDSYIYNCSTYVAGGFQFITFEVEYTALKKAFINNSLANGEAKFILAVSVGDKAISNSTTNRTMLLVDTKSYDYNADIPDLILAPKLDLFPYKDLTSSAYSSMTLWNEDSLFARGILTLDSSKNAKLNSLEFRLFAYNDTTKDMFTLDSYSFNVANAPIVGGVQQININNERGYNLAQNSNFNLATVETNPLTGEMKIEIGQKISWQDWIANNNVDNIFYNSSLPNNNKNIKASNYSQKEGYNIRVGIFANVYGTNTQGVSGNTDYLISSPNITVYDYDTDNIVNTDTLYTGDIYTINPSTNTSLEQSLLTGGQDTLFRIVWKNTDDPILNITNYSVVHRIEPENQNGYAIDELGDNRPFPANNKLIPKVGYDEVHLYLTGEGYLISECLVKGSEITDGINYKLSGEIKFLG